MLAVSIGDISCIHWLVQEITPWQGRCVEPKKSVSFDDHISRKCEELMTRSSASWIVQRQDTDHPFAAQSTVPHLFVCGNPFLDGNSPMVHSL